MATVKELKERAAELGIPGRSTMKKAELEAVIAEAEGRNEPPPVEYDFAVELGRHPRQRRRVELPPQVIRRRSRQRREKARLRKLKRGH